MEIAPNAPNAMRSTSKKESKRGSQSSPCTGRTMKVTTPNSARSITPHFLIRQRPTPVIATRTATAPKAALFQVMESFASRYAAANTTGANTHIAIQSKDTHRGRLLVGCEVADRVSDLALDKVFMISSPVWPHNGTRMSRRAGYLPSFCQKSFLVAMEPPICTAISSVSSIRRVRPVRPKPCFEHGRMSGRDRVVVGYRDPRPPELDNCVSIQVR